MSGRVVLEHADRVVFARQVVVGAPRDEHVVPVGLQAVDEVRAEEAAASGDEGFHAGARV